MSNVLKLGFAEVVKTVGIRLSHMPKCQEDFQAIAWDRHDPDHKETMDWLDAQTPGWSTVVRVRHAASVDLPIGVDSVGTFLFHEVRVIFVSAHHRERWRAHVAVLQADREAMRNRVRQAKASAPPGIKICDECAWHLEPVERVDTQRIAQFAFVTKTMALRCETCGITSYPGSEDFDGLDEAMEQICKLVGLPADVDPYPTQPRSAEWHRRRDAPPVVTIEIESGTPAGEIVRLLEKEIKEPRAQIHEEDGDFSR